MCHTNFWPKQNEAYLVEDMCSINNLSFTMIMQSVLDTAKCWSVEPQVTLVCWLYRTTTWSGIWRMWAKSDWLKFIVAHERLTKSENQSLPGYLCYHPPGNEKLSFSGWISDFQFTSPHPHKYEKLSFLGWTSDLQSDSLLTPPLWKKKLPLSGLNSDFRSDGLPLHPHPTLKESCYFQVGLHIHRFEFRFSK